MNKKIIAVIGCACILLAGGLYYFLRDEPLSPQQSSQEAAATPTGNITYSGNSVYEEKNGKRQWELTAAHITVDPKTHNTFLQEVKGTFYQDTGEKIDITAATARLDDTTKDVVLEGNIKAVDSNGATLSAAKFRRTGRDNRIYGSGGVKFTNGDTVATGDELESDGTLVKIKLSGHAHIIKGGSVN